MERKQRALLAQIQRDESLLEIEHLTQEKKEYEMLVDAFGKNGIQALLIEEILPEVEHEANALLARLTDNQMQIFIESLRDLKSGGVRETLDIQISDSVGVRPYEMFSGGEAFRIDFALRIAVSKLLARRAGTHLQTLFIDEGFGSQDEEGLSRLTQALFAVQRDFEKIIVVSHLERLKENFPVHIVVDKRSGGSVVQIEERG
jgi:exonuclease SbcC